VVGLAFLLIAFIALSVAAGLPMFLPRTNSTTATGLAFLLTVVAGLFYLTARAVIAHRLLHVGKAWLWQAADRLLVPVCTWVLYVRHAELRPSDLATNPVFIALLIILFDPGAIFGRALANAELLKSGRFLRPVVPDRPTGSGTYFLPLLFLALLYCWLIY
jgi:hypothetical protein